MKKLVELKILPKRRIESIKSELNLTEEESDIFDLFMLGHSTLEIADEIGISTRTVFRRLNIIEQKLLLLQYDSMIFAWHT